MNIGTDFLALANTQINKVSPIGLNQSEPKQSSRKFVIPESEHQRLIEIYLADTPNRRRTTQRREIWVIRDKWGVARNTAKVAFSDVLQANKDILKGLL